MKRDNVLWESVPTRPSIIVSRVLRAEDRECGRTPATGMYKVCAATQDVEVRSANLLPESFDVDVDAVERAVDTNTRLVFLCSRNSDRAQVLADGGTVTGYPKLQRTIVVVDEAYRGLRAGAVDGTLSEDVPRDSKWHSYAVESLASPVWVRTAIGSQRRSTT